MIELPNSSKREEYNRLQKANIANQFHKIEKVKKGMTIDEFQFKYPSDMYEFLSGQAVESFKNDFNKSEDADQDELKANLEGLEKIYVQKGEECVEFFVLKREKTED